jgi:Fe-S-cluster containining protein
MKSLVIDLDKISQQAKIKEKENFRFRSFLKGKDDDRVDKIVHAINKDVVAQIDCTKCGNCCNTLKPSVSENEIRILANLERISQKEYSDKNTEKDDLDNGKYLKDSPCKYLKDKKCSIYVSRPHDCRSFPHIDKNFFNSRTLGMIDNYAICPIVFNVLKRLKEEFKFR